MKLNHNKNMTMNDKAKVAKQILKALEERAKKWDEERWGFFMLGSLELLFEHTFTLLPDDEVAYWQKKIQG